MTQHAKVINLHNKQRRPKMVSETGGFVLQHRSIDNQPWSNNPVAMLVAQFLIRNAMFAECETTFHGTPVSLYPGQYATTYAELARKATVTAMYKDIGRSRNPEANAKSAVNRALKCLEQDGFLMVESVGQSKHKISVITVLNWSEFQSQKPSNFKTQTETQTETKVETHQPQLKQGSQLTPETQVETKAETQVETLNKQDLKNKQDSKNKPSFAKRAMAIPKSFGISDEMREWAKESRIQINIDEETLSFVDYWLGEGRPKKDWIATWRNWMRKANNNPNRPNFSRNSYEKSSANGNGQQLRTSGITQSADAAFKAVAGNLSTQDVDGGIVGGSGQDL